MRLSVTKNTALGTVRLGFDDADPASAFADAGRSQVSASPASVTVV